MFIFENRILTRNANNTFHVQHWFVSTPYSCRILECDKKPSSLKELMDKLSAASKHLACQFQLNNIQIWEFLFYLRPFKDKKWSELPQVVLTSDAIWDPAVYDSMFAGDDNCMKQWLTMSMMTSAKIYLINLVSSDQTQSTWFLAHKTELISDELYTFQFETNMRPLDQSLYCNHSFKLLQKLIIIFLKELNCL